MRLVMMGTGPFALPTHRALYSTRHEVAALVTQPQRPTHGKRVAAENPHRALATERGTPVYDPVSINTADAQQWLAGLGADLFIVADYGQLLSSETLAASRLGGINLHASLLPKYRGAAPINWALWHGETVTGVSIIHMTPRLDAGPVLAQAALAIEPGETADALEPRLAELGAPLVCQVIDQLERGQTAPIPQDPGLATRARRLRKSDGEIDWSRPAEAIVNQIRALDPWPRTSTTWHRSGSPSMRLIIGAAQALIAVSSEMPPGTVVSSEGGRLLVSTGAGLLAIDEVQPAGKREMPIADFLRGHTVSAGDRFGPDGS